MWRREIELYRREKELAERELEIARREIALLREQRRESSANEVAEQTTFSNGETARIRPRTNLSTVTDLLNDFDGVSSDFDIWEKQTRFLKAAYRLDDDCAKLLVGMRLKKTSVRVVSFEAGVHKHVVRETSGRTENYVSATRK